MIPKNSTHHCRCGFCRICIIAIHENIAVRIDFPKHGAHDVALALAVLMSNDCSGLLRYFCSPIRRIIVIDIHYRLRHHPPKISDDLSNRQCLIPTRNEYGNLLLTLF